MRPRLPGVTGVAQEAERGVARQCRQAATADPVGEVVHQPEPRPGHVARPFDARGQHHDRALRRRAGHRQGRRGQRAPLPGERRDHGRQHQRRDGQHRERPVAGRARRGHGEGSGQRGARALRRSGQPRRGRRHRHCRRRGLRVDRGGIDDRHRGDRRGIRVRRGGHGRRVLDRGLRDPAEAEARHRADHPLFVAVVADRAPAAQDDLGELRIGDIAAREHRAGELVAIDGALAVLDQVHQALEHPRRQRHRGIVVQQLALGQVQHVAAEAITHVRHGIRMRDLASARMGRTSCRSRRRAWNRPARGSVRRAGGGIRRCSRTPAGNSRDSARFEHGDALFPTAELTVPCSRPCRRAPRCPAPGGALLRGFLFRFRPPAPSDRAARRGPPPDRRCARCARATSG